MHRIQSFDLMMLKVSQLIKLRTPCPKNNKFRGHKNPEEHFCIQRQDYFFKGGTK